MKLKYLILHISMFLLLAACSSEFDEQQPLDNSQHTSFLRLEGGIDRLDDSVAVSGVGTRASAVPWDDGSQLYVQFQTSSEHVIGTATYNEEIQGWSITYNGTLTQWQTANCKVFYFEAPLNVTVHEVALSPQTAIYADTTATYFYSDGVVVLRAHLRPLLGRVRFRGIAGSSFKLFGLKWFCEYDLGIDRLHQQHSAINLTVDSHGYTPYVYAEFSDVVNRAITIFNEGKIYMKMFPSNVLAVGRSGCINFPTSTSKQGWNGGEDEDLLGLCPDGYHPHVIDLGLGVGYACCNVGADIPIDYGEYYAWGETTTKSYYDRNSYVWYKSNTLIKYCDKDSRNILEYSDDAAYANWGAIWRIPTNVELSKLNSQCTWTWMSIYGIYGYRVTASNGKSIFLPAAGCGGSAISDVGTRGYYWSSSLYTADANCAYYSGFDSIDHNMGNGSRYYGRSIRPVLDGVHRNAININVNNVSFNMIKVEGGTFQMGKGIVATYNAHQVTLTDDYYIGETEVTQELWTAVMGTNPSKFTSSAQLPVESVSWDDCQTFISKLNVLTGKNFRLPTEAEWEFAARGGNASVGYNFSGGNMIERVAWCSDNSKYSTHPVANKDPNELGIYDMSGNVWEWCQDRFETYSPDAQTNPTGPSTGTSFVIRGGGWGSVPNFCRITNRDKYYQSLKRDNLGFRLAL